MAISRPPALDIKLPAVPGSASDARRAVHSLAAGRVAEDYDVALAVSEAVTNVVLHAYRDREPGLVQVTATVEDDELVVVVTDEGVGMAPRVDSPGAGLGLPIMATLADRFEVQNVGSGTRLLLAFGLAASA